MAKSKTSAQLDREIAVALARPKARVNARVKRLHHATRRDESDDDWDVARDAILEHDAKKAARIYHNLRHEFGFVIAPDEFNRALDEAPKDVWIDFHGIVADLAEKHPTPTKAYYRNFMLRMLKPSGVITQTHFRASRPMSLEDARDRLVAAGVVELRLDLSDQVILPPRVPFVRPESGSWTLSIDRSDKATRAPLP